MKFFIVRSGSSSTCSGIPEYTRLSLILQSWSNCFFNFFCSLWKFGSFPEWGISPTLWGYAFSAARVCTCCWLNSNNPVMSEIPYVESQPGTNGRQNWILFYRLTLKCPSESFPVGDVTPGNSLLWLHLELEVVVLIDELWLVVPMTILSKHSTM